MAFTGGGGMKKISYYVGGVYPFTLNYPHA